MSTIVRFRTSGRFDSSDPLAQQICDTLMMDCVSLSRDTFMLSGTWPLGVANEVFEALNNSSLFNTTYNIELTSYEHEVLGLTYTFTLTKK